jgi:dihydrofolate reductase
MSHNLIDEYLLMIYPLILGTGRRLFPYGASFSKLRLVKSLPTFTGVIIATYHPAGATAQEKSRKPERESSPRTS